MTERKKLRLTLPGEDTRPDSIADKTPGQGEDAPEPELALEAASGSSEAISPDAESGEESGEPLADESNVGTILRNARLARGLELRDVASELRIRHIHLQAIEEGRFSDLPGTTYAIGFVRAYAEHLGLDRNGLVERFRAQATNLHDKVELNFPEPAPETRVPGGAILLISVLLAALAYGGWYRLSMEGQDEIGIISDVPDRLVQLFRGEEEAGEDPFGAENMQAAPQPPRVTESAEVSQEETYPEIAQRLGSGVTHYYGAPSPQMGALGDDSAGMGTSDPATEAPGEAQAESAAGGTPNEAEDSAVSASESSRPGSPAAATAEADDSYILLAPDETVGDPSSRPPLEEAKVPKVYGDESGDVRIVIKATQDSWVQVRNAGGGLVLTQILHAGDVFRVPDEYGLTLVTGNAGALEITVDGVVAPAIGPMGAIRRDVVLDAHRLQNGTAVP